jgi:hypothetical protein
MASAGSQKNCPYGNKWVYRCTSTYLLVRYKAVHSCHQALCISLPCNKMWHRASANFEKKKSRNTSVQERKTLSQATNNKHSQDGNKAHLSHKNQAWPWLRPSRLHPLPISKNQTDTLTHQITYTFKNQLRTAACTITTNVYHMYRPR